MDGQPDATQPESTPTEAQRGVEKQTMLIAFDGSKEATRALRVAAQLLRPRYVEVLTAWEPLQRHAARASSVSGIHQGDWVSGVDDEDPAYQAAREISREGVNLAESLGLQAKAHVIESATSIWAAIVDAAEELRPDVIVTGTRGISGVKALFQTSTADSLLKNSSIPLFIVPPADEAGE